MKIRDINSRVGLRFNDEVEDIKNKRILSNLDTKPLTTRTITNLIVRHKNWNKIKEDIVILDEIIEND